MHTCHFFFMRFSLHKHLVCFHSLYTVKCSPWRIWLHTPFKNLVFSSNAGLEWFCRHRWDIYFPLLDWFCTLGSCDFRGWVKWTIICLVTALASSSVWPVEGTDKRLEGGRYFLFCPIPAGLEGGSRYIPTTICGSCCKSSPAASELWKQLCLLQKKLSPF